MIMKKVLFVLVLAIMTMAVPMEAQKKAATPKNDTVPQIEAYSDTHHWTQLQWMRNSGMKRKYGKE